MKTDIIRRRIDEFVVTLAKELSLSHEEVANEAFYRLQRHPEWGRNASPTQKRASYKYWKKQAKGDYALCHKCRKEVTYEEAKFHHLCRGIQNQHDPLNLVPEHPKCHDKEHDVIKGSLSKGSPEKHLIPENPSNS